MERYYDNELTSLRSKLTQMGARAVEALRKAMQAFVDNDLAAAEAVVAEDLVIDEMETQIDYEATRYLTLRSPVASDLRVLTVAIKASHDLERAGDEAKIIAKKTRRILRDNGTFTQFFQLEAMAQRAEDMMQRALVAFIEEDAAAARRVLAEDESVDELNKWNIRAMIEAAKSQPAAIDAFIDLIFISKAIERIADHATNLAEEVIYLTTSRDTRPNRTLG